VGGHASRLSNVRHACGRTLLRLSALAKEQRSSTVRREFQLTHFCPATGRIGGGCPGYVKDHIVPLACGGADAVGNMQWQTIREAKAKDKWETKSCAR